MPSPDPEEMTPFDLSAIIPGYIKKVLRKDHPIPHLVTMGSHDEDANHSSLPSNPFLKDPP